MSRPPVLQTSTVVSIDSRLVYRYSGGLYLRLTRKELYWAVKDSKKAGHCNSGEILKDHAPEREIHLTLRWQLPLTQGVLFE